MLSGEDTVSKKKKNKAHKLSDLNSTMYRKFLRVILITALGIPVCLYMLLTEEDVWSAAIFLIGFLITDALLLWVTYHKWKYDEKEDDLL